MRNVIALPEEVTKKFNVTVDYLIIRCANPGCDAHWGVSLKNRGTQLLTYRDFVCEKCGAKRIAEEM